jgi:hypothetical protein
VGRRGGEAFESKSRGPGPSLRRTLVQWPQGCPSARVPYSIPTFLPLRVYAFHRRFDIINGLKIDITIEGCAWCAHSRCLPN